MLFQYRQDLFDLSIIHRESAENMRFLDTFFIRFQFFEKLLDFGKKRQAPVFGKHLDET